MEIHLFAEALERTTALARAEHLQPLPEKETRCPSSTAALSRRRRQRLGKPRKKQDFHSYAFFACASPRPRKVPEPWVIPVLRRLFRSSAIELGGGGSRSLGWKAAPCARIKKMETPANGEFTVFLCAVDLEQRPETARTHPEWPPVSAIRTTSPEGKKGGGNGASTAGHLVPPWRD